MKSNKRNYFFFLLSFTIIIFGFVFPAFGGDAKTIRFMVVGDTGHDIAGQKKVACMMADKAGKDPVQFVVLLGDNFAGFGVKSDDDPLFKEKFEKMYDFPSLEVPFFAALGNHDHYGNASAQISYSKKNPKWKLPEAYYTFTTSDIQFFMIDTHSFLHNKSAREEQQKWLEKQLKSSKALWKIVCGHHTVFSYGYHEDNRKLIENLVPLFEKYEVDAYLCGHGHAKEVIKKAHKTFYIVSSTGSTTRSVKKGPDSLFCSSGLGFAYLTVRDKECILEFYSGSDRVEFKYLIEKSLRSLIQTK